MGYSTPPPAHDPGKAAERKALVDLAVPLRKGDPASRHLVDVRGLDPAVVLAHPDLRLLRSPIPLRPKTDAALVALLRPGPGEDPTGAELSFVDHRGAKSATDPARITWSFVEKGCSSAWFWAGGSGDTLVLCEGFGAKALALVSAGIPGVVIGGGSRAWLGNDRQLPPGIKRAVVVADRRPAEGERDADGKPSAERHDRDYRRAADRLLLELGDGAVLITPDPPCGCCKDSDEVLRAHGAEAVRAWVESAVLAKLSPDGWVRTARPDELVRLRAAARRSGQGVRASLRQGKGPVSASSTACASRASIRPVRGDADATARSRLVAIVIERGDLFADATAGEAFCAVETDGGAVRTYKVASAAFTDWLLGVYGERYAETIDGRQVPGTVNASTRADAVRAIEAIARRGDTREVFLRVGSGGDRIFIDMATPEPRAIEVGPNGWSIVVDPPVHLVHSATAKPLPEPAPAVSRRRVIRRLARFFGFRPTDDRFVLMLGFLMAPLMRRGPYPIMIFIGEQGSGKTSRGRMLKLSIDPTRGNVRGRPKSAEDLAISVWRTLIAVFDNLSKLDQEMSDWLCRLSEGGALPKRKLFTDSEEVLIEAARPIILNAIPDIAQSGDLVDRSAFVRCDPLAEQLNEQELLDRFEAFRPELLTYLLEATACALGRIGAMPKEHEGLRRGDWASWVEAAAPALGIRPGRFLEAYRRNQDQSVRYALAVDPVAAAVLALVEVRAAWSGEASSLHTELEAKAREQHSGRIPLGWPSLTHHLVSRLRRLAPMLRRIGVEVEQTRDPKTDRSVIRLSNVSSRPKNKSSENQPREPREPRNLPGAKTDPRLPRLILDLLPPRRARASQAMALPGRTAPIRMPWSTRWSPARDAASAAARSTARRRSRSTGGGTTARRARPSTARRPRPSRGSRGSSAGGRPNDRGAGDHADQHQRAPGEEGRRRRRDRRYGRGGVPVPLAR